MVTSSTFTVDQEKYQGPLETIVLLLQKRRLHVSDVNLAQIAEEFAAYVKNQENNIAELSDFVRVMSVLLLIKTKALLPNETLGVDEEETIAQFEADLVRVEILTNSVKGIQATTATLVSQREKPDSVPRGFLPDPLLSLDILHTLAKQLSEETERDETFAKVAVTKLANLKTTIDTIERRLLLLGETSLDNLIPHTMASHDKVVHFIAILELLKQNRLSLAEKDGDKVLQYGQITVPSYGLKE